MSDRSGRHPARSAIRRLRPVVEPIERRLLLTVFQVTTTSDQGAGSLREAITLANEDGAPDTIDFHIGRGGSQTIQPLIDLPAITGPVLIDGTSQPGYSGTPLVTIDGANAGFFADGLLIMSSGVTVQGLGIVNFGSSGVHVEGPGGDVVRSSFLGVNPQSNLAAPNGIDGVTVNSARNTIGGMAAVDRNVISGNLQNGITIIGPDANDNVVIGNRIGTGDGALTSFPGALAPLPNMGDGILIQGTVGNVIGRPGAGNLIAANHQNGINLFLMASGNLIQGNAIGTTLATSSGIGLGPGNLGNGSEGISLNVSMANTIGGTAVGAGNVISGNLGNGVNLVGSSANLFLGNLIGTDATGKIARPNSLDGVLFGNSPRNTVGGSGAGAGNLLSGNTGNGISVTQADSTGNVIQGNNIGVQINGQGFLSNSGNGVRINGAPGNQVLNNVISSNNFAGVFLINAGASGNLIRGNLIGTDAAGDQLSNLTDGIFIIQAPRNTIGGTAPSDRNVISGNTNNGVSIRGPLATGNLIQGNYIGTDPSGQLNLGNITDGVFIQNAPGNTVGGTSPGAGNVISRNRNGVNIETQIASAQGQAASYLVGGVSNGNVVQGNLIGLDASGVQPLGNFSDGVLIVAGSDNQIGGSVPGARNIVSNNFADGIGIEASPNVSPTIGNVVQGNIVGLDATGTRQAGNRQAGIHLIEALSTQIGGTVLGAGNVVSGNAIGLDISGPTAPLNLAILGNIIGLGADGEQLSPISAGDPALRNSGDGIVLERGATGVTIGGTIPGSANVISGNGASGLRFASGSGGVVVEGNLIGLARDGQSPRPNNQSGVFIAEASARNTIGGSTVGAGNVISGNSVGITITNAGTSHNLIDGNLIGLGSDGSTPVGNIAYGILLLGGALDNTIGGVAAGSRNVISANGQGISLIGPDVSRNVIAGNFVGLDATGSLPRGNLRLGISLNDSAANTIGGTVPAAGNVISANAGVGLLLAGSGSIANLVVGNRIGTDALGTRIVDAALLSLGNAGFGVLIDNAPSNTIGGTSPEARNVISGNRQAGIDVSGPGSLGSILQGNYVGIDATGAVGLGNLGDGILIDNALGVVVGGATGREANVVSGNVGAGVEVLGLGSIFDVIVGNLIGTDASGGVAIGNGQSGVFVDGSPGVTIGGSIATLRNVISGNGQNGVQISGAGSTGTVVLGNLIGTDASGERPLGNLNDGVLLDSAYNVTVGGTTSGSGNILSGNGGSGVEFGGVATFFNVVAGNRIGTNLEGSRAVANAMGIFVNNAPRNLIGGPIPGEGNLISGNTGPGIHVFGLGASGNSVQGNRIGTDATGLSAISNLAGVFIDAANSNGIGGPSPGNGNLISANLAAGVVIQGSGSIHNLVQGNLIGTDATGERAIGAATGSVPLQQSGVLILDAPNNVVGGAVPAARNVISGNVAGIVVAGFNAHGNLVLGNYLGLDATGNVPVANSVGIYINGSSANLIGGPSPGFGNVISGNTTTGITLFGPQTTANVVQGNSIGTDVTGTKSVANGTGVFIESAPGNTIGGSSPGSGNLISGNSVAGVYLFSQASGNLIQGNRIGTGSGGKPLANLQYGILLFNASSNTVDKSKATGNKIANSGIGNFREFTGSTTTVTTPKKVRKTTVAKASHPTGPRVSTR